MWPYSWVVGCQKWPFCIFYSTSVKWMPAPSRGVTKSPAARKSASYPKPPSENKSQRKPLSARTTQSIATNATTPSANADDETQASSSGQNEVKDDLREIMEENEVSPSFHSVFDWWLPLLWYKQGNCQQTDLIVTILFYERYFIHLPGVFLSHKACSFFHKVAIFISPSLFSLGFLIKYEKFSEGIS